MEFYTVENFVDGYLEGARELGAPLPEYSHLLRKVFSYIGRSLDDEAFMASDGAIICDIVKRKLGVRRVKTDICKELEEMWSLGDALLFRGRMYGAIETMRDFGRSDEEIISRLREKYHITEEAATGYIELQETDPLPMPG